MCVSPSILVFALAYAKGHNKRKKTAKEKKAAEDKKAAALSSKGGENTAIVEVTTTTRGASGKKLAPAPTRLKRGKKKRSEGRRARKTSTRGTVATLPYLTNCAHRVSQQSVCLMYVLCMSYVCLRCVCLYACLMYMSV